MIRYNHLSCWLEPPYRYQLLRAWGPASDPTKTAVFVMLNPSTADGTADDQTVRKCVSFATRWGCNRLEVVNLFAIRGTDPGVVREHQEPIGPKNDAAILEAAARADILVAAWGTLGAHLGRDRYVRQLLAGKDLRTLKITNDGQPGHPLYLPLNLQPQVWRAAA